MKKIFCIVFTLLTTVAIAQNPTTYFMEGTPLRSQWNPAFASQRGYVNIPVLGGLQANVQGNIALDDILCTNGSELLTILSSSVSADRALSGLQDMNRFGMGLNMNLLGFGAYTKNGKNFWSFDVSLRADAGVRAPYELFDFLKRGNSGNFANLGADINTYIEAGFTYSFPIMDKLYLGVRGKFLLGAMQASFNFDEFDAYLGEDRWYAHVVGSMSVTGAELPTKRLDDGTLVYDFENFGVRDEDAPGGCGFGIDVGATYDVLPNLQVSLSVNDIGFMSWSKKGTSIGQLNKDLEFEGVEVSTDGVVSQPRLDLDELNFVVKEADSRTKALRASVNAGGEYNFFDRKIGLGLFYSAKFWEYKTQHNLTASANFRPMQWLHLSGSYSFINNRGGAVGLALNICPKGFNLFVATDMLLSRKTPQWIPISQSNVNVTFGLGINIGKKGLRNVESDE